MDSERHIYMSEQIAYLRQNRDTILVKSLINLIDRMVEKERESLDEATPEIFPRVQGKIAILKQLKEYITKDVPSGRLQ